MRQRLLSTGLGVLLLISTGCVERRLVVETTPPGARVFVNDVDYGTSPAFVPFTYYGIYNFRIMADGYQTQTFQKRIRAPLYAYPPFDFFAESLWPFQISDIRNVEFDLQPVAPPDLAKIKADGAELRSQGQALPPPREPSSRQQGSKKPDESKKTDPKTDAKEKLPESEMPKVVPPPPPPSPRLPQTEISPASGKNDPYRID